MKRARQYRHRGSKHRIGREKLVHHRRLRLEPLEDRRLLTTSVPGLVSHWNFDEGPDWHDDPFQAVSTATVAHDSVGGNHAALTNMNANAWRTGQQFTSMGFQGAGDYLSTTTDLNAVLGGSASLAFWLNTIEMGDVTADVSPGVVGDNDARWGWIHITGRIGMSIAGTVVAQTDVSVNGGDWHFIVFTRDATTGHGQVYVDGRLSGSGVGPTGTLTTTLNGIGTNGDNFFEGRLDQLYLFDRVIDQATIDMLMDNHAPKTWDVETEGVSGRTFSTESLFFSAFDPEHDSLSIVSFTAPAHGTAVDNGDGTFDYTSAPGYVGSDSFEVVVEDGRGGFSRASVLLEILPDEIPLQFTAEYVNVQELTAGGFPIAFPSFASVARAIDWDNDGLNDLLVGGGNYVWLYHNSGTAQVPSFDAGVKVMGGGNPIYFFAYSPFHNSLAPIALADMTGDGVMDLIAESYYGLRVYPNTAAAGQEPVYGTYHFVRDVDGNAFDLADKRFDLGDWNGDGLPDLVVGTYDADMQVFLNVGTAAVPVFESAGTTIRSEAYNVYPRLMDITHNGVADLIRGINWGSVLYWTDPSRYGGVLDDCPGGVFTFTDVSGAQVDMRSLTKGAIVDFADFNGDGVLDMLLGGHNVAQSVYIAYGQVSSTADFIARIESVYDAHPDDLGVALEADNQQLLDEVEVATQGIINLMEVAPLSVREQMYGELAAHVAKYAFLQLQELDTDAYHHVPSLVAQNIMLLHRILPDTPTHRQNVADVFGMAGLWREIYLEFGLVVGDNMQCSVGQLESLQAFLRTHPRPSYPDSLITVDQFFGDGRDGIVDIFEGGKNVFGTATGTAADAWPADLTRIIPAVRSGATTTGDIFTFVVGHETTHSLDAYVRGRANTDLNRRWGQSLVLAGGPDVVAGADGWIDWTATQDHFTQSGYWNSASETWDDAWDAYWATGPGAPLRDLNFMRGDIGWFLDNSQESLATQANQHWADSEGRIIGAIDRFRRGYAPNITEVMTFLDFISVGMNRIPMFDIDTASGSATWQIDYADVERDHQGHITRLQMAGRDYVFYVDTQGVYVNVITNVVVAEDDHVAVVSHLGDFINPFLFLDVGLNNPVKHVIRRQRIGIALVGFQFRGGRLGKTVGRDDFSIAVDVTCQLIYHCFRYVGKNSQPAGHISVESAIAHRKLRLVASGKQQMAEFIGKRHQDSPSDSSLEVFLGDVSRHSAEMFFKVIQVSAEQSFYRHRFSLNSQIISKSFRVGDAVLGRVLRRHEYAEDIFGSEGLRRYSRGN